eukprot:scaffold132290_cov54-Phaeocystis_antarctica.AAC.1
MSTPRAPRSVESSTLALPALKSVSASSRSRCECSPCSEAAEKPPFLSAACSALISLMRLTKT